jgi:hypothetical protein
MPWPQAIDYNAAVQDPARCFADADLGQGQVAGDVFGLPRPHSGNFADVYQVSTGGASWAVKCFTRPADGLRQRYQAASDHLRLQRLPFMVDFCYLEEGIKVRGQWYPVLKMKWVEGLRLNEFVAGHLDRPAVLERLSQMWLRLAEELRQAGLAHGDLQHGNVLLVPGSKAASLALRLIDYDGLWVPALADAPSGEVGHPNYQHPQRLCEGFYSPEADRFAHLVICTALRCLAAGGAGLWERHDSGENMLFREEDFLAPARSRLWPELWALDDGAARALTGHLLLASQGPVAGVPLLEDLFDGGAVRPLDAAQEARVRSLIGAAPPPRRRARAAACEPIPPLPVPLAPTDGPDYPLPSVSASGVPDFLRETAAVATLGLSVATGGPPVVACQDRQASRPSLRECGPPEQPLPAAPVTPPPLPAPVPARWVRLRARLTELPIAGLGVFALLVFVGLAVALRPTSAPPAPPPAPPRLLPLEGVILRGGASCDLEVRVARNDFTGPLTVRWENLPPRVHAQGELVLKPGKDRGRLRLVAGRDAVAAPCVCSVVLLAEGRPVDEGRLAVTVQKFVPPVLGENPEEIRLHQGETFTLRVGVQRRGYTGPLVLRLEPAIDGVSQQPLPQDGDRVAVELTAAADARPVPSLVRLKLFAGDELLAEHSEWTKVIVEASEPVAAAAPAVKRPRLVAVRPFALEAGKAQKVKVEVDRQGYEGPVDVAADTPAQGLAVTAMRVPPGADEAVLEVRARADLAPKVYAVKLVARVDGRPVDEKELSVRVEAAAPVVAAPAPPEAQSFVTVDGVTLHGKLYPGRRGKDGACVLLVHDLGGKHHGGDLEPLARALHGAGHTVLQLDLRGHGASTAVVPAFWTFPQSQILPAFRHVAAGGRAPALRNHDFPAPYWPWIVQDLAAARALLEVQHDIKSVPVNVDNLVVIAAGEAAALAGLWLAAEAHRFGVPGAAEESEASAVAGAVFLSPSPNLGRQPQPAGDWLRETVRRCDMPMGFVHGADDRGGADIAGRLLETARGDFKVSPLRKIRAIPHTREAAERLLRPGLGTEKIVVGAVEDMLKARPRRAWALRQFRDRSYYWAFADGTVVPAKGPFAVVLAPVPLQQLGVR